MCLKKDEVFEDIDRNEIVKIIKRKANKRVIEGGCGRQEKMVFREKAKNGTNSKRN